MRIAPAITLSSDQQATLEQWAHRSLPAGVVERARIVPLAAESRQNKQIASAMKIKPKKVSRWRSRFLILGMAGLERDASRPGRTPKITASLARRFASRRGFNDRRPSRWSRNRRRAVGVPLMFRFYCKAELRNIGATMPERTRINLRY